jgi:hypothetical protein
MIDLSNITLWSSIWTANEELYDRTKRVLRYCNRIAKFKETVLFSSFGIDEPEFTVVDVPTLTLTQFNILSFTVFPKYLTGDFVMQVHEDGFPTHPELWNPRFLKFDYIGAPWPDGVIGNGGFSIESKKLNDLKAMLNPPDAKSPWSEHGAKVSDSYPSDTYICRIIRPQMEAAGVRFAPKNLAENFSTEQTSHGNPSFGFHGRTANPNRYADGWKRIEASEV